MLLVPAGLLCAPSLAAGAAAVSALAPDHARGLVMGLHASVMTAGGALASSGTGLMIDIWTPATAVLVVGGIGVAAAAVSGALARASPRRAQPSARSQPA